MQKRRCLNPGYRYIPPENKLGVWFAEGTESRKGERGYIKPKCKPEVYRGISPLIFHVLFIQLNYIAKKTPDDHLNADLTMKRILLYNKNALFVKTNFSEVCYAR
jgi:hypothetical protein